MTSEITDETWEKLIAYVKTNLQDFSYHSDYLNGKLYVSDNITIHFSGLKFIRANEWIFFHIGEKAVSEEVPKHMTRDLADFLILEYDARLEEHNVQHTEKFTSAVDTLIG